MAQDRKRLLIVDDTEIDRIILRSILNVDFEIDDVDNGNAAFEYLTTKADQLDAILLDISMPNIDGFDVLRFMRDKGIVQIPVFLVTAEATRDNVQRALEHKIAGFIGKPFDREDVPRRLRSRLGVVPTYDLKNEERKATAAYIADLDNIYQQYLSNFGKSNERNKTMSDLMKILLTNYDKKQWDIKLNPKSIDIICQAAYFCDIGEMLVPDKRLQNIEGMNWNQDLQQRHTMLGNNLVRLNRAKSCEYFVEICSDMCLHHHERLDGQGYPHGLEGKSFSLFNQMCRLVDEFVHQHSKFYGNGAKPVKFVIRRLVNDYVGMVDPRLYTLLEDCEQQIVDYFLKKGTQ